MLLFLTQEHLGEMRGQLNWNGPKSIQSGTR